MDKKYDASSIEVLMKSGSVRKKFSVFGYLIVQMAVKREGCIKEKADTGF